MAVTRRFLDWRQPALPAAAEYLISTYAMLETVDLSGVVVVVPGRRAGRRLLELLVESADRKMLRLTPPTIETAGCLPELLYEPKLKFASDLINKFAWTAALRELNDASIRSIIPDPPKSHDISRWLSFGELLWKQHRELAAEGFDFQDVATRGPEVDAFDEAERWEVLRTVQEACLQKLDAVELWDLQSARLFAIKHQECRTDKDIVLVGTSDLNTATCEMLEQVSDRVTALVHAPPKLAKRFDDYGCIVPDAWSNVTIDLDSEKIAVAEGPVDQAEAVVATLAGYQGRYRMDEVTIGMTDERLVPEINRHLAAEGVASRWVVGQQLNESRPYRLLAAVAEFLETKSFDSFASLIRHSDLDAWLFRQPVEVVEDEIPADAFEPDSDIAMPATVHQSTEWLRQLDDYFNRHLPSVPGDWIFTEAKRAEVNRIQHVHQCISSLLETLSEKKRPLSEWVQPLNSLLLTVYGDVEFDLEATDDSCTLAACTKIHDLLLTHSDIPPSLIPTVESAQAIRLLLKELTNESVPPPPNDEAVELLGWLELPLDDSPALVVTMFNEGYVPSSLNSDAFLPNELRRHLGLLDNRRRYARDAYAMSVLAASRSDLQLIVGRRDMRGDPLRPSRLLFAAQPTEIAQRILTCFGDVDAAEAMQPTSSAESNDGNGFTVPRPVPLQSPIERIGVTSFRTYLACPYRFYLRHALYLKDVDDSASELDALMFGNLMHEVLNRFGHSRAAASLDVNDIRSELNAQLLATVNDMFGKERVAAVDVQVMQIQARLSAFAEWQANWAAEGWRIQYSEASFRDKGVKLELDDGRTVELDGRIDRIDRLGSSNQYVIFDYKSSENVRPPRAAHQKKDEWVDLQLPLYRHLVKGLGLKGDIKLGYIVLPKDTKEVKSLMADWTDEELKDADAKAIEVATKILDEQFWPPADVNPMFFQEFAAICQDNVFDREVIA
ncbi:PD-(D/E)XK nuclease family protein [Fuerstiella marisgermanici]|uniref:ATP-dependent helicase/deoxyribonuclease subunit B n=1 Tax=Fuerstiella marisgermanici TaxID=1891926 RepID=A0A1P8WGH0_9PLAN|nr:PD-(D/E)XK nuclease family protein [Fuerstiella marisgermanici]APZ93171.1 ATP-dependent helicase/deoxyribonuclease subunit B [Fuerstiella marisgermanici]